MKKLLHLVVIVVVGGENLLMKNLVINFDYIIIFSRIEIALYFTL